VGPDRPKGTGEPRNPQVPERFRYKPMGIAYQGALESVFAIALGTGAGWWADRHFDTSPVWLIVGATIGFGAFVLRLYRLGVSLNAAAGESDSPGGDEPE